MKGEVKFYAVGLDVKKIYFPNGEVCCFHCPFRKEKNLIHTYIICVKTYEPLNSIDIYNERGRDCPLEIQEEIADGKHENL